MVVLRQSFVLIMVMFPCVHDAGTIIVVVVYGDDHVKVCTTCDIIRTNLSAPRVPNVLHPLPPSHILTLLINFNRPQ